MKKENAVIGLIVVGGVAFFLGRMSVSSQGQPQQAKDKPQATAQNTQPATPAAQPGVQPAPAAAVQPAAGVAPAAQPVAQPKAAAAVLPARPAGVVQPAVVPAAQPAAQPKAAVGGATPPAGTAFAIAPPTKGVLGDAKVTIYEISDYQ